MRSGKQEHETDSGALCAQGEQDARALTVRGTARAKRDGARLETALRTLRRAHARQSDTDETGAAEWLLDNWYPRRTRGTRRARRFSERAPAADGGCRGCA